MGLARGLAQGLGSGFQLGQGARRQRLNEQQRAFQNELLQAREGRAVESHGLQMQRGEQQMAHADELHPLQVESAGLRNQATEQQMTHADERHPHAMAGLRLQNQAAEQGIAHGRENMDWQRTERGRQEQAWGREDIYNDALQFATLLEDGHGDGANAMLARNPALSEAFAQLLGLDDGTEVHGAIPMDDAGTFGISVTRPDGATGPLTESRGSYMDGDNPIVFRPDDLVRMVNPEAARRGPDGSGPADVQTAEWLVANGIAPSLDEAWQMVRTSREKSPEVAISELAAQMARNNPRFQRDPQAALTLARQLYYGRDAQDSDLGDDDRGGDQGRGSGLSLGGDRGAGLSTGGEQTPEPESHAETEQREPGGLASPSGRGDVPTWANPNRAVSGAHPGAGGGQLTREVQRAAPFFEAVEAGRTPERGEILEAVKAAREGFLTDEAAERVREVAAEYTRQRTQGQ